ncbi:MAG TPA: nucleotidyltransferase family protein [Chthoniobacterales bacterium]|jgi:molybdenum cofactor cytidylyltransferase
MDHVGAVILAAGESTRFGRPKQLANFRDRTLLDGAIAAAREANCQPIVVVTGSDAPLIENAIAGADVIVQRNPKYGDGIGTSIRAGIERLIEVAREIEGVALLVCDQPFVTGAIIRRLIKEHQTSGKPIAASEYSNTCGVPALFHRSCFTELLKVNDGDGAKSIIFRDPVRVIRVQFSEGEFDIDTPGDYAKLESR